MSALLFNILLGLVPTLTLAWSIAADEKKQPADRVVDSDADRSQQRRMFVLIYGLWALTLAMWNWMRSYPWSWVLVWAAAGVVAIGWLIARRKR